MTMSARVAASVADVAVAPGAKTSTVSAIRCGSRELAISTS